jgi:hypothetical protein
LLVSLNRPRLADQPAAHRKLRIDTEAGDERLARRDQRQPHPAHEIGGDVNTGLSGLAVYSIGVSAA